MIAFKLRGRNIQILRSSGDGESESETLGAVKSPTYLPDSGLAAKLAADELREVEQHAERRVRADRVARDHAACSLAETLRLATDWLKSADPEEALAFAGEVREPFARLRRLVAKIAVNEEGS